MPLPSPVVRRAGHPENSPLSASLGRKKRSSSTKAEASAAILAGHRASVASAGQQPTTQSAQPQSPIHGGEARRSLAVTALQSCRPSQCGLRGQAGRGDAPADDDSDEALHSDDGASFVASGILTLDPDEVDFLSHLFYRETCGRIESLDELRDVLCKAQLTVPDRISSLFFDAFAGDDGVVCDEFLNMARIVKTIGWQRTQRQAAAALQYWSASISPARSPRAWRSQLHSNGSTPRERPDDAPAHDRRQLLLVDEQIAEEREVRQLFERLCENATVGVGHVLPTAVQDLIRLRRQQLEHLRGNSPTDTTAPVKDIARSGLLLRKETSAFISNDALMASPSTADANAALQLVATYDELVCGGKEGDALRRARSQSMLHDSSPAALAASTKRHHSTLAAVAEESTAAAIGLSAAEAAAGLQGEPLTKWVYDVAVSILEGDGAGLPTSASDHSTGNMAPAGAVPLHAVVQELSNFGLAPPDWDTSIPLSALGITEDEVVDALAAPQTTALLAGVPSGSAVSFARKKSVVVQKSAEAVSSNTSSNPIPSAAADGVVSVPADEAAASPPPPLALLADPMLYSKLDHRLFRRLLSSAAGCAKGPPLADSHKKTSPAHQTQFFGAARRQDPDASHAHESFIDGDECDFDLLDVDDRLDGLEEVMEELYRTAGSKARRRRHQHSGHLVGVGSDESSISSDDSDESVGVYLDEDPVTGEVIERTVSGGGRQRDGTGVEDDEGGHLTEAEVKTLARAERLLFVSVRRKAMLQELAEFLRFGERGHNFAGEAHAVDLPPAAESILMPVTGRLSNTPRLRDDETVVISEGAAADGGAEPPQLAETRRRVASFTRRPGSNSTGHGGGAAAAGDGGSSTGSFSHKLHPLQAKLRQLIMRRLSKQRDRLVAARLPVSRRSAIRTGLTPRGGSSPAGGTDRQPSFAQYHPPQHLRSDAAPPMVLKMPSGGTTTPSSSVADGHQTDRSVQRSGASSVSPTSSTRSLQRQALAGMTRTSGGSPAAQGSRRRGTTTDVIAASLALHRRRVHDALRQSTYQRQALDVAFPACDMTYTDFYYVPQLQRRPDDLPLFIVAQQRPAVRETSSVTQHEATPLQSPQNHRKPDTFVVAGAAEQPLEVVPGIAADTHAAIPPPPYRVTDSGAPRHDTGLDSNPLHASPISAAAVEYATTHCQQRQPQYHNHKVLTHSFLSSGDGQPSAGDRTSSASDDAFLRRMATPKLRHHEAIRDNHSTMLSNQTSHQKSTEMANSSSYSRGASGIGKQQLPCDRRSIAAAAQYAAWGFGDAAATVLRDTAPKRPSSASAVLRRQGSDTTALPLSLSHNVGVVSGSRSGGAAERSSAPDRNTSSLQAALRKAMRDVKGAGSL